MDIFAGNLPPQMTEKQVTKYFERILAHFNILTYRCSKSSNKHFAIITVPDASKAKSFLAAHGQDKSTRDSFQRVRVKLFHMNRPVYCCPGRSEPDPWIVSALEKQEADKLRQDLVHGKANPHRESVLRTFEFRKLWCGQLDYENDKLGFAGQYRLDRSGTLTFTTHNLFVAIRSKGPSTPETDDIDIRIPYTSVQSSIVGSRNDASLTFSLYQAPSIFRKIPKDDAALQLAHEMGFLSLKNMQRLKTKKSPVERNRLRGIDEQHAAVVSICLCYRFALHNPRDIRALETLKRYSEIPVPLSMTAKFMSQMSLPAQLTGLNRVLSEAYSPRVPFDLKFQIQKLAYNAYLSPVRVTELFQVIMRELTPMNTNKYTDGVHSLLGSIPHRGPGVEAYEFSVEQLMSVVRQGVVNSATRPSYGENLTNYDHMIQVYKAMVTPTGLYLFGPTPEVKNRVLRKYSAFSTYFLSVSFLDEDGEILRHDLKTSNEVIYEERYRKILEGNITVAGRPYEFLGFSHSSLRAHTCWFMAPFIQDGTLTFARAVIKELGDFSMIRSPAKCAARIGQAFSQTLSSIKIPEEAIQKIDDVQRNGRTFSDGVGTCSQEILYEIWDRYSIKHTLKATVFQIRFKGAKGVISLDSRLKGPVLRLRDSMIKFEGSKAADIEICGSAVNPLPMVLNRQLVKILEDLKVPEEYILELQGKAVEELRNTTLSARSASKFLRKRFIGTAAKLPWMFRRLDAMRLSFNDDDFLRNVIEIAVLSQLREMKYRARIPVRQGVTLYGIMDETATLREKEIYCSMVVQQHVHVLTGDLVVTRCPALHPGDVQCVVGVDMPNGHPLKELHNVVVFSSKGERDLPSMLSGGDLDGDLYNIIYDPKLYPHVLSDPADYTAPPPIDIGRPVERHDMTDHLILFMRNDQLGRIATLHQILADQADLGVFDEKCIRVAEMHSTAVDFSKTGIPVKSEDIPAYPKARPDFLANGPRVLIGKKVEVVDDEQQEMIEDTTMLDEARSYEPTKVHYYGSNKVLGKLYRSIDEHEFLHELQQQAQESSLNPNHNVLGEVWNFVRRTCELIQWQHMMTTATEIKESYEENLVSTMMTYATHPSHPLSEVEVFAGCILGRNGSASKRQREYSVDMKDKHNRDVAYTVSCITLGIDHTDSQYYDDGYYDEDNEAEGNDKDKDTEDGGVFLYDGQGGEGYNDRRLLDYEGNIKVNSKFRAPGTHNGKKSEERRLADDDETLARSIACFYVGLTAPRTQKRGVGALVSFAWVAATLCLREVDRFVRETKTGGFW